MKSNKVLVLILILIGVVTINAQSKSQINANQKYYDTISKVVSEAQNENIDAKIEFKIQKEREKFQERKLKGLTKDKSFTPREFDKITKMKMKLYQKLESMTDDELLDIAILASHSKAENIKNHMVEMRKINKEDGMTNYYVPEVLLFQELGQRIGKNKSQLLSVPHMLTVKVNDINEVPELFELIPGIKRSLNKIVIKGTIEEVIKGKNQYKAGDDVEFFYFPTWNETGLQFELDASFFVCLEPEVDQDNYPSDVNQLVFFNLEHSRPGGIFQVDDGVLIDKFKTFHLVDTINWQEFKNTIDH